MAMLLTLGRILFVVIFVLSGAMKLMDITGTAQQIASQVPIPEVFSGLVSTLQDATGMTGPQILAVLAGLTEVIGGLLIAFNIATRPVAILMALFTLGATLAFHDFWNMAGADRANNMIHALKNLSIFGGFLIIAAVGSRRTAVDRDLI